MLELLVLRFSVIRGIYYDAFKLNFFRTIRAKPVNTRAEGVFKKTGSQPLKNED